MPMEHKLFTAQVKAFNDQDLTIDHFISVEVEDRSKDIVRAKGMIMNGLPAVLKDHGMDPDTGREPIAKPVALSVQEDGNGNLGVLATTKYYDGSHLTPPDNTGRKLYEKARDGFMDKWSIGFISIIASPKSGGGRDIKKWEVLEYSQVGVPDNTSATTAKDTVSEVKFCIARKDGVGVPAEDEPATEIPTPEAGTEAPEAPATPEIPATPPVEEAKDEKTVSNLSTLHKSIQERVQYELAFDVMHDFWWAFLDELSSVDPDEKSVKGLMKEFNDVVSPWALYFSKVMHGENPELIGKFQKQIDNKRYDAVADAEDTPAPAEEVSPEETPSPAQPEKSGLKFCFGKDGKPATSTPTPEKKRLPFTLEDITSLIASETKKAYDKALGKVS